MLAQLAQRRSLPVAALHLHSHQQQHRQLRVGVATSSCISATGRSVSGVARRTRLHALCSNSSSRSSRGMLTLQHGMHAMHGSSGLHGREIRRAMCCSSTSSSGGGGHAAGGQPLRIAVVGAGVVGLTSALRILQDLPGSQVTILAEKFGTDTTTAGAAGIWGPYKLSDTPEHLVNRWAGDTFCHLTRLFYSPDGVRAGLSLVFTHYIHTKEEANTPPPSWHDVVFNFQEMDPKHVALLPGQYVGGYSFNNITCEGRYYLQYLADEIQKHGGRLVQTRLQNLGQVLEADSNAAAPGLNGLNFDAVVDCCGLGASDLLGDKEVYPIRGQIMRVRAPWVTQGYFAGDFYIIPNRHSVVLGGTGQVGNWNTRASLEDKARIWKGCCDLVPSLVHAEVIEDWVGLRPGRSSLRLELDELHTTPVAAPASSRSAPASPRPSPALAGGSVLVSSGPREAGSQPGPASGTGAGQQGPGQQGPGQQGAASQATVKVPVVHNYGHGGAGLTLGWGCAGDVVALLKQALGRA